MKHSRWMWLPVGVLLAGIGLAVAGLYFGLHVGPDGRQDRLRLAYLGLFVLFMLLPVVSFLFDFCLYKANRPQAAANADDPYKPRPHIWGLGFFLSVGSVILFFLSAVTLHLLHAAPASNLALAQNITLFLAYAALLGVIVLAILKVYRPE